MGVQGATNAPTAMPGPSRPPCCWSWAVTGWRWHSHRGRGAHPCRHGGRLWHGASHLGAGPWHLWELILQSHPSPPGWRVTPRGCSVSPCHPHCPSPGASPAISVFPAAAERITQTVEITKHVVDIEEKGVKLRLTIVDTPGFGDAVNNTEWCVPWRGGSGVSPGLGSAAMGARGSEGGMPTVPPGGMLKP